MKSDRIGVCTWSLGNNLNDVSHIMSSYGLRVLHLDVRAIPMFQAKIKENDWIITSTMVSFPNEDYSTLKSIRDTGGIIPDEYWGVNRETAMQAIRDTARLKVPFLSTHAGFIDHRNEPIYEVFRSRILELADAAQQQGVTLLMETGQETAEDLRHCLRELNHPSLGVNFDPANMLLYDKGDPVDALYVLAPWIQHVHIKDARRTTRPGEWGTEVAWGEGEVPHEFFLKTLKDIGYRGTLAIEREAGDRRIIDIQNAVTILKKYHD